MYIKQIFHIILGILVVQSCQYKNDQPLEANFIEKGEKQTGISFSNALVENNSLNIIEYLYYYNGAGVAVGDINNDGLDDIYFCGNQTPDQLYLNKGNLQFDNITQNAGIKPYNTWSTGVSIDDVNGDGWMDIYVCKVSMSIENADEHNLLYINQGNNTFVEKSKEFGVAFKGFSTHAGFFDYDKDGDLDLYLLNQNIHNVNSYGTIEKRQLKDTLAGDILYENKLKESGKFVDVSQTAGIYGSPLGYGLGLSFGDVNNDGWTDIYVGNDFHENDYLYLNNGNKTFTESIKDNTTHTTQFSMGVDVADMNNDGWLDIFSTDMMPFDPKVAQASAGEDSDQIKMIKKDFGFLPQTARNHFQLNQQNGQFADIALMTQTFATDWSWSVLLQDFDNDLYADIFITNGIVKRPNNLDYINYLNEYDNKNPNGATSRTKNLIDNMPSEPLRNILFRHTGDLTYTSIDQSFVGEPSFSTGAAYADFDQDGDLDIVMNNINNKASLLENKTINKNYLHVKLKGNKNNPNVKGSKVMVYTKSGKLTKELQTTRGFMSSSTTNIHFGLGAIDAIDSVVVIWPNGKSQSITKPTINKKLEILLADEGQLKPYIYPVLKSEFAINILPIKHEENKYFDENNEKLIPERLSTYGPALICADLNGDRIEDIFVGGAKNQPAKLYIGNKDGSFHLKSTPDFERDAKYEDVDAALIDFDKDGDKDIYVVSGGSEAKELDKTLEDRIYFNNGNGIFKRIPLSLPHTNGGCVAIADYDGDGYEDIFLGSRSIPGNYGLSPYSFILRNAQGRGVEIGYKERYGMVTDAQWVDLDGDKDLDLVMCGDWMDVTVLINEGSGKLVEKTKELGLEGISGLWNTVEIVDINHDGIKDIIAGNAGLNHKWKATLSQPVKMYVGDFDKNGSTEPLIFYYYFSRYMPFASLSMLTSQMPMLKRKYENYNSFKNAKDISDLFENYKDNLVETKLITDLRSMCFLSQNGKYQAIPLEQNEQISEIMDIVVDADDIYYIGNFWNYISELGPSASNSGRVLGKFNPSTNKFDTSKSLHLPIHLNGRKIKAINDNKLVIADNNGYLYLLNR
jgi:hypothetical protein